MGIARATGQAYNVLLERIGKKGLVRLLMETSFFFEDVKSAMAYSLPMRPLSHLVALANAKGMDQASSLFENSQKNLKASIDLLGAKIDHEIGLVHLANDKANSHGFAAIDRMKSNARLDSMIPKETRDLWSKSCAQLDKSKVQRKRKSHRDRSANKKRKGSGKSTLTKPLLPTCADCGKVGHLRGDAKCKSASKPT